MPEENYLIHHGILGMKWGVRRFQNEDGTLTRRGKQRLTDGSSTKEKTVKSGFLRGRSVKKKISDIDKVSIDKAKKSIDNVAKKMNDKTITQVKEEQNPVKKTMQNSKVTVDSYKKSILDMFDDDHGLLDVMETTPTLAYNALREIINNSGGADAYNKSLGRNPVDKNNSILELEEMLLKEFDDYAEALSKSKRG